MVDGSTTEGIYKIRGDCEETIKTLETYKRVSEQVDIKLSDFVKGQLKGAIDQLERIRQLSVNIIAEREEKDEKKSS